MKKHLLLLALLPTLLFAQTPFGYGATWHFSFSEYGFSGYLSLTHVGDTTINSYVWQKFQRGGIRHIQTGPDPYNDVMQWPIGGYYFLHSRKTGWIHRFVALRPDPQRWHVHARPATMGKMIQKWQMLPWVHFHRLCSE